MVRTLRSDGVGSGVPMICCPTVSGANNSGVSAVGLLLTLAQSGARLLLGQSQLQGCEPVRQLVEPVRRRVPTLSGVGTRFLAGLPPATSRIGRRSVVGAATVIFRRTSL
jgi:hypothetical protein